MLTGIHTLYQVMSWEKEMEYGGATISRLPIQETIFCKRDLYTLSGIKFDTLSGMELGDSPPPSLL